MFFNEELLNEWNEMNLKGKQAATSGAHFAEDADDELMIRF